MQIHVVVLVGGLGTRLLPLSWEKPKPLMPILQRPGLSHLLDRCPVAWVKKIWLAAGYGFPQFQEYLAGLSGHFGVPVELVREETPLGTGGALEALRPRLEGEVLVLNGDTFVALDLPAMVQSHRRTSAHVTMAAVQVADASRYGSLTVVGDRLQAFCEKHSLTMPGLINAGAYLFSDAAWQSVTGQAPYSLERDVFPGWLREQKELRVWTCGEGFLDFGTPHSYLQAQAQAMSGQLNLVLPEPVASQQWLHGGARVASQARLEGPVWIGAHSRVEAGAWLRGPVTLGEGCLIGEGSRLSNCLLWDGAQVGAGCDLESCLLGSDVNLPQRSRHHNLACILPRGRQADDCWRYF